MSSRSLPILLALFAASALGPTAATACQVPVFRYALERWRPQAYEIVVFHRGPFNKSDSALINSIAEFSPPANLAVSEVDLEMPVADEVQQLWKTQSAEKLPWIVVQVPGSDGQMHPFWSGPLESADFKQLVDSPLRRAIGRHLVAGESAVWLFVEGGDPQRDDAAFQLLKDRLKKLERCIELPVPDPTMVVTDLPLKLSFPIERVSWSDTSENLFLRLMFFRDKTPAKSGEPVVVPIFGRGRALPGLNGADINAREIDQIGFFLAGQCSCEVKEQCPGHDLLIAFDWDSIFLQHATSLSVATTRPAKIVAEPPFVAAASLSDVVIASPSAVVAVEPRRTVLIAATGAAALLVIFLGWLTFRRGSRAKVLPEPQSEGSSAESL